MPEEINRIVTDALSDLLWTPSPDGDQNLLAEGKRPEQIERVGNIMIDSFELLKGKIEADTTREDMGLKRESYALLTLHRPSNVDDEDTLNMLVDQLTDVSEQLPLLFPVHPRTRKQLAKFGLLARLENTSTITLSEPLAYIQFMNLVLGAKLLITDSGGIQEESSYLGIPCLTLRPNTERPATIELGTNKLVKPASLAAEVASVLKAPRPGSNTIPLWDGHTAQRVSESLRRHAG